MNSYSQSIAEPRRVSLQPAIVRLLAWLLIQRAELYFRWERQRQRRQLLELDDDRLHDLGLSREQAQAEGSKGFWQR